MNEAELKELLRFFQVVAYKVTHANYSHTVDKARTYMQLVAGVGLDKRLRQYVRREDEKLFEQRVNLTQHIVTSVCKNLLDVHYKVPRSNSARRTLTYQIEKEDKDAVEKKVKELEDILGKFWGTDSFDDFMATRFIELNALDPNTFVVLEWDAFNGDKEFIQPRPYEVPSAAAVDYSYHNKDLQYLIVKGAHWYRPYETNEGNQPFLFDPTKGVVEGEAYTYYGKQKTWQVKEIDEKDSSITLDHEEGVISKGVKGRRFVRLGQTIYEFFEFKPHGLNKVPAMQVGCYRDLATNGATFVNPLHAIEPYLLKLIKVNSEFDLTAALLAFPQQLKYGQVCPDDDCFEGFYEAIENGKPMVCKTCNGSGARSSSPTAQDAIVIPMPDSKEQLIPLQELITYVHPPVDIVAWQQQYIDHTIEMARRLLYNTESFGKQETAKTATGTNLDMQNVYDTLYPCALRFSKVWTGYVVMIADLADKSEGLIASHSFGKDFKMKSMDSLIADLTNVKDLGDSALVQHVKADIAQIMFAEKPLERQRYDVKQIYNPFAGKSEQEISKLMMSDEVVKAQKVLYANYGTVFDDLELEYAAKGINFYNLKRMDMRVAIYKRVAEIIVTLEEEEPPEPDLNLGGLNG